VKTTKLFFFSLNVVVHFVVAHWTPGVSAYLSTLFDVGGIIGELSITRVQQVFNVVTTFYF